MKIIVISKGNPKQQRARGGEGKPGPGRNPGGAMIVCEHENGSRDTRHLRYSGNSVWKDSRGNGFVISDGNCKQLSAA